MDVEDPGDLRSKVVQLLLRHPEGVRDMDFSGAFYKLHGHHPRLVLHGCRSLKDLLFGMKNVVVQEKNSLGTVLKLAHGSLVNHWLQEWEESDSFEEDMQSIMYEADLPADPCPARTQCLREGATNEEPAAFMLIRDVLGEHPKGLKLLKLKRVLDAKHGFNLDAFSEFLYYEDALACLQDIPGLRFQECQNGDDAIIQLQSAVCNPIRRKRKKKKKKSKEGNGTVDLTEIESPSPAPPLDTDFSACNVNTTAWNQEAKKAVLEAAAVPILSILGSYPKGLSLLMLKKNLKRHGFNLERFSQDVGYEDAIDCLLDLPWLRLTFLTDKVPNTCVIQLLSSSPSLPALPQNTGSLHIPFSSCAFDILPPKLMEIKPAPAEVLALITNFLNGFVSGLRVKKLQTLLLTSEEFDLEKFSIDQGYKDALEFLQHRMPELKITQCENRLNSLVKCTVSCDSMSSQASSSLPSDSNCSASKFKTLNPNVIGKKPASPSSTSSQPNTSLSFKSECSANISKTLNQNNGGRRLAPAEVLALITKVLMFHPLGLKVKKLQTLLLTSEGFDLEKFSVAQGYKDALELLKHQMPEVKIQKTKIILNHLVKCTDEARVSCNNMSPQASMSLPSDSNCSASKSKTPNPTVIGKKPASPSSTSSQPNTSLSLNLECSASISKTLDQNNQGKSPAPAEVLALITNVLIVYPLGLRVKKLQTLILTSEGFDLEKFSIAQGYKDALEFLEHQMPELKIEQHKNRPDCLVKCTGGGKKKKQKKDQGSKKITKKVPAEVLALITNALMFYPLGLKVKKLQTLLLTSDGFDLEKFSVAQGYKDALELLKHQMPDLKIKKTKIILNHLVKCTDEARGSCNSMSSQASSSLPSDSNCSASKSKTLNPNVIGKKPASPSSTSSQPNTSLSLNSECSASISKTLDQNNGGRRLAPAEIFALIIDLLNRHASGLRVKKLQTLLLTLEEFDLEKFSIDQGYKDALEFLEHQMPELKIAQCENRLNSLVKCTASPGSTSSRLNTSLSGNSECSATISKTLNQKLQGKRPAPAEVLALITNVLMFYPLGLRVKKLQTLILTSEGFDLEKFSIAQGYKDALEFLEHQMPELKIEQHKNRPDCLVKCTGGGKKKQQKKDQGSKKITKKAPAEVSALVCNVLNHYASGLRVKKLQALLLTSERFNLEKFSIAHGYKDTLEFLEHQMPELKIEQRDNRLNCLVKCTGGGEKQQQQKDQDSQEITKQSLPGPDVNSVPPLPESRTQLEPMRTLDPPNAAPDVGCISKPFVFGDFSGLDVLAPLQDGLQCRTPVPFIMIPNHLSSKEHHSASSGEAKSSSQPNSDIPAQLSSARQFGEPPPARVLSCPMDAQLPSKPSLTELPPSEDLAVLKQQVASILALHPEGMSLFQFRAAYSTTYQHHLPLGNASSAKQRLLEMSDIVCMKGYGVQTLLLPVSPEEPPTKSGLPVISRVENVAMVPAVSLPKAVVVPTPSLRSSPVQPQPLRHWLLGFGSPDVGEQLSRASRTVAPLQPPLRPGDNLGGQPDLRKSEAAMNPCSLPKAVVKVKPMVAPEPSGPKTPVEPQPRSTCPLASDHIGIPDIKENCVVPKGPLLRASEMVAAVRPKASLGGQPDISKEAAMKLSYASPRDVVTIEPVVLPKSSIKPSLSKTEAVPMTHLHPSSPLTSTCLRAPANKDSSFLPETQLPRPPKPVAPVEEKVRARATSGDTLLNHHAPMVFPAEPHVTRPHGNWASDGLASRPKYQAVPSFSVNNIPAPPLFQPVFTNFIAMAQPVVYPVTCLPETLGNPSLGSLSHQSVSRTQLQTTESVSPHLAQQAPQRRPAEPASPIRCMEQAGGARTAHGLEPLLRTSRAQGQSPSPAPVFSADGYPVSPPSIKPPSFQSPASQSLKPLESFHQSWSHSMQRSSAPVADHSTMALPSAKAHSKRVAPGCPNQYVAVTSPITSPRKPSSAPSQQPARSSLTVCTESGTESYKPPVSVPRPHYLSMNSAMTTSSTQPSTLLTPTRGSPTSTGKQPSYFSISSKTGYDASCQRKLLPGISGDLSEPDNHHFTLPDSQKYHLKPEPLTPLQTSPAVEKTCVIL